MPPAPAIDCRILLTTPHHSGAVATLQLAGDVAALLERLTGTRDWLVGSLRLVNFAGVDDGLAVRVRDDVAMIMPHGGLRIVHQLAEAAVAQGAQMVKPVGIDPRTLFPEAEDAIEAMMLAALARAESTLAIDLLLAQPERWRSRNTFTDEDRARSLRLNRLIAPPLVVLAGVPNVGKSTLTNALVGRSTSITADMPGTTRDYIAARINIAGLVVDWADTPGIRASDDAIEQRSIHIANELFARADLVIAMTAPGTGMRWPVLPRPADIHVLNKIDIEKVGVVAQSDPPAIKISALTGANISELATAIREALVPQVDLEDPGPWLFDERLLDLATSQ